MGYRKPLLVELIAQFHFKAGSLDGLVARMGSVWAEIGLDKVELGTAENTEFTFKPGNEGEAIITRNSTPTIRCWSENKDRLAQLLPGMKLLAVNVRVGPEHPDYRWEDFTAFCRQVIDATKQVMPEWPLESVALVSIDRLQQPKEGFRLGNYFDCRGQILPQWCSSIAETADVMLGRGIVNNDGFNNQIRLSVRPVRSDIKVDVNSVFHEELRDQNVFELLDKLHDESKNSFESLITDRTRHYMGGLE